MTRSLVLAAALSVVAGTAVAANAAPVHGACAVPAGATKVVPGAKPVESTVATPVGAGNAFAGEPVGTFVLDLAGKPQSSKGKVTFTLSWANPASDYDLVVNGTNELATDNPEVVAITATHCRKVEVGVEVFIGVPVDELTLSVKGA